MPTSKQQQLHWKWTFGFRVAGSNFLANTSSMDRRSPRREWGVHYVNNNKLTKKSLTTMVPICVICFGLFCIWGQITNISPRGLIFRGAYYRRDFCVSNSRGLYLEGLIFVILQYSKHVKISSCPLRFISRDANSRCTQAIFLSHSNSQVINYHFSLPHLYISLLKAWEDVLLISWTWDLKG